MRRLPGIAGGGLRKDNLPVSGKGGASVFLTRFSFLLFSKAASHSWILVKGQLSQTCHRQGQTRNCSGFQRRLVPPSRLRSRTSAHWNAGLGTRDSGLGTTAFSRAHA